MARKKDFGLEAVEAFLDADEQEEKQQEEKKAKREATLVSWRISNDTLRRFRGFAIMNGGTQIEAIEKVINDYLDGKALEPEEKQAYDAFMKVYKPRKNGGA